MLQFKCNAGLMKTPVQRSKHQSRHIPSILIKEWRLPLWTLEGVSTSSLLRRSDLLKMLFVCICLCHICPVTSCGVDPMRYVENYARSKGFDSTNPILNYMRLNTPSDYDTLMKEKQEFIACTRMVHTGYFKRSMATPVNTQQLLPVPFVGGTQAFAKQSGNRPRSPILANRGDFDSGSYLQHGLEASWTNSQPMGQLDPKDTLSLFDDESFPSFLQRLKQFGQPSSSVLLRPDDQFGVPEFYKELNRKRR